MNTPLSNFSSRTESTESIHSDGSQSPPSSNEMKSIGTDGSRRIFAKDTQSVGLKGCQAQENHVAMPILTSPEQGSKKSSLSLKNIFKPLFSNKIMKNIKGAVSRLDGFSSETIQNTLAKRLNPNQTTIEDREKVKQSILDSISKGKLTDEEALVLVDHINEYVSTFNCSAETAYQALHEMKSKLSMAEIKKIVNFVKIKKGDWEQLAKDSGKSIYIPAHTSQENLPRGLNYETDGSIYILFNKVKSGDELLGKGNFKNAKATLLLNSSEMATRLTQVSTPEARQEAAINIELSGHEGIVRTYSVSEINSSKSNVTKLAIIQKLYNGGDLEAAVQPDSLRANKKGFPAPTHEEKTLVAKKIISAFDWLHHTKNMIHRDLKPANILLERDSKTGKIVDAVLTDFGFTCSMDNTEERSKLKGTREYMAPEIYSLENEEANQFPNDNWALGLILYQLFKADVLEWESLPDQPHWFSKNQFLMEKAVTNLKEDWLPEVKDSNSIGFIIRGLLQIDPQKRMDTSEALAILARIQ